MHYRDYRIDISNSKFVIYLNVLAPKEHSLPPQILQYSSSYSNQIEEFRINNIETYDEVSKVISKNVSLVNFLA